MKLIPTLVLTFMILTIFLPIVIEICQKDKFEYLLCLKEFTVPCWIIVFSLSWLYHRIVINKNEDKYEYYKNVLENKKSDLNFQQVKEYSELESKYSTKLNHSIISMEKLEQVIAGGGIFAGAIGIVVYFL